MNGAGGLRTTLRALRARNYRLFFFGQLVSLIGTWMQSIAQSWLVYRLTSSPALLGLIGFAGQVPIFFLAPVGGALADRVSKRAILLATQTASMLLALTLAALTLSGRIEVHHVFVLATLLGIVNAIDVPTRQAFVVDMVGKGDLINAIALNSSLFNAARMVGPAVAGLLVAAIGEGWCFFANGVSYVAVIAGLFAMRDLPPPSTRKRAGAIVEAAEGLRFVARTHAMRTMLMLLGGVGLFGVPYMVLMPTFADRVLGGSARELGWLMGAAGLGALGGALTLARRQGMRGLGRMIAIACAVFGVGLVGFASSRALPLSLALLVVNGFAMIVVIAGCNTLIQSLAPDALRGRVMAAYSMIFMGTAPIGALGAGFLAERFGAPLTVGVGGVVCTVAAGVFARELPRLRESARALYRAGIGAELAMPPDAAPLPPASDAAR